MTGTLLSASGVGYDVGVRTLVRDVDLVVERGELVAVIGPNGAGKTTLLRLLSGDLDPTDGEVRVAGHPMRQVDVLTRALLRATMMRGSAADVPFTAGEVVAMGRYALNRLAHTNETQDADVVADVMRRMDVAHLANRVYQTLSGGEQDRVDLARTIAQDTPVLLLDEPTSALDIRHQSSAMMELASMASAGRAVVAVLHDLNLAASYASRVVVMAEGSIVADGPPVETMQSALLSEVYEQSLSVVVHPLRGGPLVVSA